MKQTGILATCERCGKTEFFADEGAISSNTLYNSSGWSSISYHHVCPECYDYYIELRDTMLENFWGLKKDGNNDKSVSIERWEDISG